MKKNILLLSLFMISGVVGSLKARLYENPYDKADRILYDAVRGKKVNGFDFYANPSLRSLTDEQINAYFAARAQAGKDLFADPSLYLTPEQFKAYTAAMKQAAQDAWEQAQWEKGRYQR